MHNGHSSFLQSFTEGHIMVTKVLLFCESSDTDSVGIVCVRVKSNFSF